MVQGTIKRAVGRTWFLTELFYPDQTSTAYIVTRIAERVACEIPVTVICGPSSYERAGIASTLPLDGRVNVLRAGIGNWNKNAVLTRLIRALLLTIRMTAILRANAVVGDTVVVVTNPPTLLVLVASLCRRRGLRFLVIVHDVFPENLVAAQLLARRNPLYGILRRVFNRAYDAADRLIVLGRDMREVVEGKIRRTHSDRIAVVQNWADTEAVVPRQDARVGPITLQFAGNFGRVQGLMSLLDVIRRAANPNVAFDFVGTGALRVEMEDYVTRRSLTGVRIHPPFSRSQQSEVLNACDIGVVSLAPGMLGLGVPSKAYNILAAGKPILFVGDPRSEVAMLVAEAGVGWVFTDFGDELLRFLQGLDSSSRDPLSLMGARARMVAESRYSEKRQLNEYFALIAG